ncbi:FBP domain-containing protein [Streptomyces sp. NPDC046925]|uniref:FBP domain-containing protein n=1 Tax=Streptomyces sp. NPDC046925 TaxID=3155375 RepID=UPI0033E1D26A
MSVLAIRRWAPAFFGSGVLLAVLRAEIPAHPLPSRCRVRAVTNWPAPTPGRDAARRAGKLLRDAQGGALLHLCADLACSLYLRTRQEDHEESLTLEEQNARTVANLHGFIDKVLEGSKSAA